jgi:hypothetical protein
MRRRARGLFFIADAPTPFVVFQFHPNQHLGAASEGRSVEVLTTDRPVEHVTEQPQRSVDGRRGQPSDVQAADHALLEVRHEVVDVDLG